MSIPAGIALIGSGPSLAMVDPRRLAGLHTIAFNRSWLAWKDWGFSPRYHASLDPATIAVIGPELAPVIAANRQTRFFLDESAADFGIAAGDNVTLCHLDAGERFAGTISPLTDYGNVGAISMQVLYLLGYRCVLLVGVDGDYQAERSTDRDANHFRDDYGRGRVPMTLELRKRYTAGWPVVAAECVRLGIEVRNASPGTALTCFERTDLLDGIAWLTEPRAVQ